MKLYLVTDRGLCGGRDLETIVLQAVEGGVTMVQLREKNIGTREFVRLAMRLKKALDGTRVPLIINDRVDVALAADADGVHIGQSDMPYDIARRLLGPDRIIGLSIETLEQLEEANRLDLDYVAASPVFATPTKTDTHAPWGLDGLRRFKSFSRHPVVGIGGMNALTARSVFDAGADGIAVVSAIVAAEDPREAAVQIITSI
ncbi:MAG: thiamine phosphate synthase [Bacteroidales bacterium]|nr:thiamine phosphate synthase [Bacteroidales bacterium]